ncbi:hypothetical protein D018_3021B, partial [Vibrio parahaemolyticus VP2007-007]
PSVGYSCCYHATHQRYRG